MKNTRLTKQSVDVDEHNKVFINPQNLTTQLEGNGEVGEEGEVELDNDILHTFLPGLNSREDKVGREDMRDMMIDIRGRNSMPHNNNKDNSSNLNNQTNNNNNNNNMQHLRPI